jgi:predicted DNA-binding transcriptional regulator AlpA
MAASDKTPANNMQITSTGLRRLKSIIGPLGPIPVSRSTWWAGVKSGRFPAAVRLGPRITAWRSDDIEALVARGISQKFDAPVRTDLARTA